jgi:hypothetical protein
VTPEQAIAIARYQDAEHRIAVALRADSAERIVEIAQRMEAIADEVTDPHRFAIGDRVQVRGLSHASFPWFDGVVTGFVANEVEVTVTSRRRISPTDPELAAGKRFRRAGDPTLRKVSR